MVGIEEEGIIMAKCAFGTGSSTIDGKQHAPERCKKAIWEAYKKVIEKCEIERPDCCPLRAFISEEALKEVRKHDTDRNK